MRVPKTVFTILVILFLITGCSGDKSPVSGDLSEEPSGVLDSIPIIATGENNAIGLFGAYTLSISADRNEVELTPMRTPSIGEGYIVSGLSFFDIAPCADCLKWDEIVWYGNKQLILRMSVKHPFPKGNTSLPPTAKNRLDLDVFDLALLVKPRNLTATNFPLLGKAYTGFLYSPDGFTKELSGVTGDPTALPYKICYEDPNNNRFEMGTDYQSFDLIMDLSHSPDYSLYFDMYMTMGYGASAKKLDRLHPTYYVPEFNRKAAWKVKVVPSQWDEDNTTEVRPITIDIYDWNHGVDVSPIYPDPLHTDRISDSSDISSVSVEIPDMLNSIALASSTDGSFNGWDDPKTYTAEVANEKDLPEGAYIGLVKVLDSRSPGSAVAGGETDTVVHSPDGVDLIWYNMPEFATYQSFMARVRADTALYTGGISFGGVGLSIAVIDELGDFYVAGYFEDTVDFDPSENGVFEKTANGPTDAFLSKFDRNWNFQWVYTWGGPSNDEARSVVLDNTSGRLYVTGFFEGLSVDLDPTGGISQHNSNGGRDVFLIQFYPGNTFNWAKTWGSLGIWDEGHGLASDSTGVYVTGCFEGGVNFNPDGIFLRASNGAKDVFLSKWDYNGHFLWAGTWGGGSSYNDEGHDVVKQPGTSYIYVTGYFQGQNVDLNPALFSTDLHSSLGSSDVFLSKFQDDGTYIWAKTFGAGIWDEGFGLAANSTAVFVTGCFEETVDFDPDGGSVVEWTSHGGKDVFLSKFDNNGNLYWAKAWGSGIWDEGHGLAVDDTGVYVTGFFQETVDFDPGPGEDLHTANTGKDIFLSKFGDGFFSDLLWSRTWESSDDSEGNAAGTGSAYVVGKFTGWMDMDPGPGEDWHHSSDSSVFVTRLTSQGNYEDEPNDTCGTADWINRDSLCNGFVQEAIDPDDYWVFTSSINGEIDIYLSNYSGYDINLYLYSWDCSSLLTLSTLPAGSDEQIIDYPVSTSTDYKILISCESDGYFSPKDYGLCVIEN